jgi:adhesin/invasin
VSPFTFLRVPGTINFSTADTVATFTPATPLFSGRSYGVGISQAVTDVAGNRLLNPFGSQFIVPLAPETGALPTGATVLVNPPALFADGRLPTTISVSNININNTVVPNGTRVALTADPAFVSSSVGGVISGSSVGVSPDGRFLLFETLGGRVDAFYTPPDLTGIVRGATAAGVVQVASVDADGRPSGLIAQGTTTVVGINSATLAANPTTLPANGTSTSVLTVTVRDRDGNLVPDGTPVALTAAPSFALNSAGGTITDGTASSFDSRVKLFTTVGGQFTATYQSPTSRGSGTAVIQIMTVDRQDRPTSLIVVGTITLQ